MSSWLQNILSKIHELATLGRVRFTLKAIRELTSLDLTIDQEDALKILVHLASTDFSAKIISKTTGEWMYIFKPEVGSIVLYIKLILRHDCIVVSFHEDIDHENIN